MLRHATCLHGGAWCACHACSMRVGPCSCTCTRMDTRTCITRVFQVLRVVAGAKPLIVRSHWELQSEQIGSLSIGGIVRVLETREVDQVSVRACTRASLECGSIPYITMPPRPCVALETCKADWSH